MTSPEHTMVGILGAMALGLHTRFGWPVIAFAAVVSNVPDLDGLPVLYDMDLFESGHRVWCHNLLVIVATSALLGWTQFRFRWIQKIAAHVAKYLPSDVNLIPPSRPAQPANTPIPMTYLILVGIGFQCLHLCCDMFVSGGRGLSDWPVKPFWPFLQTEYVFPLIPWGDIGPTVIMMAGIIGIAKFARAQFVAILTLGLLIAYMVCRGYWSVGL
ncbi:MAG: metal-dependent hydrolase [Pirellulales bacterium]|jgi:membrane-bound metal-dependent hydrolase YbcI (DUF457 family)